MSNVLFILRFKHHLVFEIALATSSTGPTCITDQYSSERYMCFLLRLARHDRANPIRSIFEMLILHAASRSCSREELKEFFSRFPQGRQLWRRVANSRKYRRRETARAEARRLRLGLPLEVSLPKKKSYDILDADRLLRTTDGLAACLRICCKEYDDIFCLWRLANPTSRASLMNPLALRVAQWSSRTLNTAADISVGPFLFESIWYISSPQHTLHVHVRRCAETDARHSLNSWVRADFC
jgi:hypothetical protein